MFGRDAVMTRGTLGSVCWRCGRFIDSTSPWIGLSVNLNYSESVVLGVLLVPGFNQQSYCYCASVPVMEMG